MKKLIILLVLTSLFACGSDDSILDDNDPNGSYITANVNGINFTTINIPGATSAYLYNTDFNFIIGLAGAEYNGTENPRSVGLVFGGLDFDSVVVGYELNATNENEVVAGSYFSESTAGFENGGESDGNAYVKITAIDKVNQTISGEFNFIAIDDDNVSITYTVTNGVFNNLEYSIQD
ncbi:DUF6252 family protein [Psychroserpens sp. AS72]|uniref:DUF6252 family protein n=1 Tax=Psychroserpens sp. AS72 TaxID=3135775 RepID=UPI003172C8C9